MNTLWRYITAVVVLIRPYNSLLPLSALYIGGAIVGASTQLISIGMIILFAAHSALTLANDIEDIEVDVSNGRDVTNYRLVRKNLALSIVVLLVAGGFVTSLVLLPVEFSVLFLISLVLSWAYNSKPLQLSRRPISSIVILGICYGMIPLLMGVALNSVLTGSVLVLGLFFGVGRASLSILKDYKDARGDAKHGKKTFLLSYGRTNVQRVSIMLAFVGYAGTIVTIFCISNSVSIWSLICGVIAVYLLMQRLRLKPAKSYEMLNRQFHLCLHYELAFYGALAIWTTLLI